MKKLYTFKNGPVFLAHPVCFCDVELFMWRWRLRSVTSSTDSSIGNSNIWCDSTSSVSCYSLSTLPQTSSSTSLSGAGSVASCATRFSSRSASVAAPRPWRTTSTSSSSSISHASLHRDCSTTTIVYMYTRCTHRPHQAASLSRTAGLPPSADQPITYLLTYFMVTSPVLVIGLQCFILAARQSDCTFFLHAVSGVSEIYCTVRGEAAVRVNCSQESYSRSSPNWIMRIFCSKSDKYVCRIRWLLQINIHETTRHFEVRTLRKWG